jgi:hypothetical protein
VILNFNDLVKFTGKQIPVNSTVKLLYPTVTMPGMASVEANFGDNPAKPFCYAIEKCPGLVFGCENGKQ